MGWTSGVKSTVGFPDWLLFEAPANARIAMLIEIDLFRTSCPLALHSTRPRNLQAMTGSPSLREFRVSIQGIACIRLMVPSEHRPQARSLLEWHILRGQG